MRIAFTADNHLLQFQDSPDRYHALRNILQTCGNQEVDKLVIAGDLFDKTLANYSDFENLVRTHRPDQTKIAILPGNHDPDLSDKHLAAHGVQVYSDPIFLPLDDQWWILLIPYQKNTSMGQLIASFAPDFEDKRWILVSHGDYTQSVRQQNPAESGTYFPLTRGDLQRYNPAHAFLGHIHRPHSADSVIYPGSPCPLNRTETGLRRFLIFDTSTNQVSSIKINNSEIFFQENFLLIPGKNQEKVLRNEIDQRIQSWSLPPGWEQKTQPYIQVLGYAQNRSKIIEIITNAFSDFLFSSDTHLDLSRLYHHPDPDRDYIAAEFQTWLNSQDWLTGNNEITRQDVLFEALKIIYGAY